MLESHPVHAPSSIELLRGLGRRETDLILAAAKRRRFHFGKRRDSRLRVPQTEVRHEKTRWEFHRPSCNHGVSSTTCVRPAKAEHTRTGPWRRRANRQFKGHLVCGK